MNKFHKSQLLPGEVPVEATLPDGRKITVLLKDDDPDRPYVSPGRPGNFGGCADSVMAECNHFFLPLKGGRQMSLFVNTANGLVVIAIIDKDEKGGVEIFRKVTPQILSKSAPLLGARRFILEALEAPSTEGW